MKKFLLLFSMIIVIVSCLGCGTTQNGSTESIDFATPTQKKEETINFFLADLKEGDFLEEED